MLFLAMGVNAQIHIWTSGTLENELDDLPESIINLPITGYIDIRDIDYITYRCYNLKNLDLSDANIVEYVYSVTPYSDNELPGGSLYGLPFLTTVILPETLISIGSGVLNRVAQDDFGQIGGLTSIEIPEGVTSIGSNFAANHPITTIVLPKSLTSVGACFIDCFDWSRISEFTIINKNPSPINLGYSYFHLFLPTITVYVPFGSKTAYENTNVWKELNIIELPDETTEITEIPTSNSATIEWQPYANATGYKLLIYSDEAKTNLLDAIELDITGKKQNIKGVQRAQGVGISSYTIENLQNNTTYYYSLETLGVNNVVLSKQNGDFTTQSSTGINDVEMTKTPVAFYSLMGVKLQDEPASGMYIILYDNGTAEKVTK